MKEENLSTALIVPYLATRYNIQGEVMKETLEVAQKSYLYNEIKSKTRHEKLYRAASNKLVDLESSSLWQTKGNISTKEEAHLCYL